MNTRGSRETYALHRVAPRWPAPATVHAFTTTRHGGISSGPWASLNLGARCGDDPACVSENRRRAALGLPSAPRWLNQIHGRRIVTLTGSGTDDEAPEADGAVTRDRGVVCAVLTADCLPVVLCDRGGGAVAVAHAGWRGLAGGVIDAAIDAIGGPTGLMAWLGPAIGPDGFEVGDDVRDAFVASDAGASAAFVRNPRGRWQADLFALARRRLARCGVDDVYGGDLCTWSDAERFFSYRRDGVCGRMATLVWID